MKNILRLTPLLASLIFACGDSGSGGAGGDSCFVRGTRVLTPAGWSPIEALAVGDEVLSYDTLSKAVVVRKVARLLTAQATRIARVRAGELVVSGVSLSHPVWDEAGQQWTRVGALSLGAKIIGLLPGATPQCFALSELSAPESTAPVQVFNLEVDGEEHNYFAEGILVHNKTGGSTSNGGGDPIGGNCFVRGTRVLTPTGWCVIEKLAPGDEVKSYDTATKSVVTRKVAELLRREVPGVARLQAGELTIAGVSLEHPVWNEATQRWTPVGQLSLESSVVGLLPGGAPRVLTLTHLESQPSKAPVEVWNLEVDGEEHNYFAEGILVHNKSGGGDPEGGFGGEGGDVVGGAGGDVVGGAGGAVVGGSDGKS
jgi:hypothetical protein